MSKDIKDYIPYYIGQKFMYGGLHPVLYTLQGIMPYKAKYKNPGDEFRLICIDADGQWDEMPLDDHFKLCLRRLEDMTEEEMKEYVKGYVDESEHGEIYDLSTDGESIQFVCGITSEWQPDGVAVPVPNVRNIPLFEFTPDQFHYLLSRGYDLFGLIQSGQAIDINSLK